MRTKGKITSWNDDKGYGFVAPFDGGKQIFLHMNALGNRERRPVVHDVVTYSVSKDKQGRPCAANATLAGDKLKKKEAKKSNTAAMLFAVLFLMAVGISGVTGNLPILVFGGYLALSVVTVIYYAMDKSAAKHGRWRTSEHTLLLLGLVGGWPGALIAQEKLRHKSKKSSFRTVFWATVILNCAALIWLHSESGSAFLQELLA